MPTYKIRGIDVDFPFEAYDCQIEYMEKVIQALQERCNALLESPTGTGKTLCLLCATLAYRKSLGEFSTGVNRRKSDADVSMSQSRTKNLPTIIYTSRTHSQLRQVIKELKRSNYRPKMVVLGSREQLCIHDEVSLLRGKAQTNACQFICRKRAKHRCAHYPRVADYVEKNPGLGDEPIDIEELVNIGRSCGPCPYYLSRELHKVVDILFAPYNYLIDRSYRKSLKLDWDNSILIFDEAHNLESICADAASFDLPSSLLTACIAEAKNCIDLSIARREKSNEKSQNPDNYAILRALLLKLEKRIAEVPIESKELGFTQPGPYMYDLLSDLNITHETASKLIDTIEEAAILLEEERQQQMKNTACRLESMCEILRIIFRDMGNPHAKYYNVHVQEAEANALDAFKGKPSRTLSWWCFNPGVAMEEFSRLGVGSIILTSGTLSPMDSFAQELKLDFPVRLENPHVISPNQLWAGVVPTGPSGYSFNSSYRNRDSLEYKQELGNAIVNFARIVPDGVLVFFPSYYILDQCIGCWKNMSRTNSTDSKTIWERICMHKQPVIEPRQSSLFLSSIEDFMSKLKDTSTSGAVFFAVCRGKVSEGLDFADHAGRAVVLTGIPFATRNDPKVRLKREFLDQEAQSQTGGCKVLTGEEWYNQQASRAVNQAVGRVIRHRDDYGAIIFCDERFAYSNRQSQISQWIQPHIKCYSKFGDVVFTLTRFFRDEEKHSRTKLKLIQERGYQKEMKTAQPIDKFDLKELQSSPSAQMDYNSSKLSSSMLEVKVELGEIPPANRSFTPCKKNQALSLKCANDLFCHKKKLMIPGRENTQHQNCEIIDLTDNSLLDEKPSREQLVVPSSGKKRKILRLEHDTTQCLKTSLGHLSASEKSHSNNISYTVESVKLETSQISDTTAQMRDAELLSQENKVPQLSRAPCDDEETRGSTFLIQVQQKLTTTEYKEFVGFMKALKTKAMKIGHVLQSIIRLFSGPERLPLLIRFKDYIPSKYHPLYEQYLEKNEETANAKS